MAAGDPIVQTIVVDASVDVAFEHYTARIGEWWPSKSHSIGQAATTTVHMEPHVGGRIYEESAGAELAWGVIRKWDPPACVVHSWHPGRSEQQATEVEVTFSPHEEGTLVRLEHRDWHKLGAEMPRLYESYSGPDAWGRILLLLKEKVEGRL